MKREVPKWADRFLQWFCEPSMKEDIQGDLYEYFNRRVESDGIRLARIKYVLDVFRFFKPHVVRKPKFHYSNPFNFMKFNFVLALRSFLKSRLIGILNLVGLITGITCAVLISLWVISELSYDSFHAKSDRIFRVPNTFTSKSETFTQAISGPALGAQIPGLISGVEAGTRTMAIWSQIGVDDKQFVEKGVLIADPNIFEVFSFKILQGSARDALTELNSIVLTPEMATKYFGIEDPINKTLVLGGERAMKVSALVETPPPNSQLQFDFVIAADLVKDFWSWENMDETWIGGAFHTYVLLNEGVNPNAIEKEINDLVWEKSGERQRSMDVKYNYFLQPLTSIHLHSDLRYDHPNNGGLENVYIFAIVGLAILLLASINYINLIVAGSITRAKEIGIKKVLGAMRSQIAGQHLLESVLSVLVATAISLGVVYLLLPFFETFTDSQYGWLLKGEFFLSIIAGSLILGILSGLYPAVILSRYHPSETLKGNFKKGAKGMWLRKTLIIFQFAVTITLLISILVINRQMKFINSQNLGLNHKEILYVNIENSDPLQENFQAFRNELMNISGVINVSGHRRAYPVNGLSNGITMVENSNGEMVSSSLYHMFVDYNYADTYGLKLLAGRFFSEEFPSDSTDAIVVNLAAVKTFGWGEPENAIGKKFGEAPEHRFVIGVVNNFNFETLRKNVEPLRILPVSTPTEVSIKAEFSNPAALISGIEKVWKKFLPGQAMNPAFMDNDLQNQYTTELRFKTIFAIFAGISIIIACLGLFGLATFSVQQQTKEIGIRKVLGASTAAILKMINQQFLLYVVAALLFAIPLAIFLMRKWLNGFAYKISLEISDFIMGATIALIVAVVTISYHSLMAARTNPVNTLKAE